MIAKFCGLNKKTLSAELFRELLREINGKRIFHK